MHSKSAETSGLLVKPPNSDPIANLNHVKKLSKSVGIWALVSFMSVLFQLVEYGVNLPKTKGISLIIFVFPLLLIVAIASFSVSLSTVIGSLLVLLPPKELAWTQELIDEHILKIEKIATASIIINALFITILAIKLATYKS